jgi:DNA (cytosine-5)-methyltransferase 1
MIATEATRRRGARTSATLRDELIVDNFAGGGGASMGIEQALGRAVDIAVNHDRAAVEMHSANHPHTVHLCQDVWTVNPLDAVGGRKVGLLWLSPDCKHFSRAKGGKPVEKKIRDLAWVAVKWAEAVRPRVIILENVREFREWGPLVPKVDPITLVPITRDGQLVLVPCLRRKGQTFAKFCSLLRSFGYVVEVRDLNAADYGAPTHRRRLFLIARCDGKPIVWPEPTHGPGRAPYRTAAECIDWTLPCPSIFLSKAEAKRIGVIRPLAENTTRRIAMGIKRYVLDNPKPFIVTCNHGGPEFRGQKLDEPLRTVCANRDATGLVTPNLVEVQNGSSHKGHRAVDRPAHTVTANPKGGGMALVAPTLIQYNGEKAGETRGQAGDQPLNTVVSENRFGLVSAFLMQHYGEAPHQSTRGQNANEPIRTITPANNAGNLVVSNLVHLNYGDNQWSDVERPLRTVTAAGQHHGLVYSFLTKYYSTAVGQGVDEPLHTATTRDRCGVVTVTVDGQLYAIADIGLRMLTPRELARAQGFPDEYVLTGTKSNQVARIGNSVCPPLARAIVAANCADMTRRGKR